MIFIAKTGKDLLLQEIQKSNEDAERRHQERVELQRNFIDFLKDAFQALKSEPKFYQNQGQGGN